MAEVDLAPTPMIRLTDLRLRHQRDMQANGISSAEHLDYPTVEMNHDSAKNDLVHPRIIPPLDGSLTRGHNTSTRTTPQSTAAGRF